MSENHIDFTEYDNRRAKEIADAYIRNQREVAKLRATLAERDATIERLTRERNEARQIIENTCRAMDLSVQNVHSIATFAASYKRSFEETRQQLTATEAKMAEANTQLQSWKDGEDAQRILKIVKENRDISSKLAEVEKDKERLDWLETLANVRIWEELSKRWTIARDVTGLSNISADTLRSVIDAARSTPPAT